MLLLSQLKNRIKVVLPLLSDSLADDNVLLNKKILVVVTRVIVNWNSRKGENRDFFLLSCYFRLYTKIAELFNSAIFVYIQK